MAVFQKPKVGSFLELHFVVLLLGFTAILGKFISLSAMELVFYRTFLTALGLFLVTFYFNRPLRIEPLVALKLISIGFLVGLHWFLFFYAARVANVSVSLVGLATSTLWTALLQPLFIKTKIRLIEIFLGFTMILGLYLIFNADISNWQGLLLSIASAFTQAIFSLFNASFTKKYHSLVITFYEMVGASLIAFFILLLSHQTTFINGSYPKPYDWLYLLILALVCSVYAYSAIIRLLIHISPFSINLATNLEPVYGIVLAYFIFGEAEKMTIGFYIGTLIICLAVFSYQYFQRKVSL